MTWNFFQREGVCGSRGVRDLKYALYCRLGHRIFFQNMEAIRVWVLV